MKDTVLGRDRARTLPKQRQHTQQLNPTNGQVALSQYSRMNSAFMGVAPQGTKAKGGGGGE